MKRNVFEKAQNRPTLETMYDIANKDATNSEKILTDTQNDIDAINFNRQRRRLSQIRQETSDFNLIYSNHLVMTIIFIVISFIILSSIFLMK